MQDCVDSIGPGGGNGCGGCKYLSIRLELGSVANLYKLVLIDEVNGGVNIRSPLQVLGPSVGGVVLPCLVELIKNCISSTHAAVLWLPVMI